MRFKSKTTLFEAAFYDGTLVGDRDAADPTKVVPETAPEWFPALSQIFPKGKTPDVAAGNSYSIEDDPALYLMVDEGTAVAIRPGDWIVCRGYRDGTGGYDLDVITGPVFEERFEPVEALNPDDYRFADELELVDDTTLTPLENPLQIADIDAVSFAAVTAHMAAGQLYGLLTTEEGGLVPDWMNSRAGDIEADVNAFAAFLHAEKLDNAETLWLQATGEGRVLREAPRWAEIPFPRRQAFTVFAQVAGKVLASIVGVQQLLEAERQAARTAKATGELKREDSIDPAPERLDARLEGFEAKPSAPRKGKTSNLGDWDGDGKPGGMKRPPRKLSIGQTIASKPVNQGGRGNRRSQRDRDAAKSS